MMDHPPKFQHANKRAVFEIACPPKCQIAGEIAYTRWRAMPLPETVNLASPLEVVGREDVFDYVPMLIPGPVLEWHLNFADPNLFFGYGTGLFAQDEIQTAEHPALGCLLEALKHTGERAVTLDHAQPTPVLIRGAERRVHVATSPNPTEGRPQGLYGNWFASAPVSSIRRATRAINPATTSNILAIAAPAGGRDEYWEDEIRHILITSYTGFRAAALESIERNGEHTKTIVHTGFWGCGAFGGNRVLMTLLQIAAAHMAQISHLIFHTFDSHGTFAFMDARALVGEFAESQTACTTDNLVRWLLSQHFSWGTCDGN
jgi:hypothetical protein